MIIVLHDLDLRLTDNEALYTACKEGENILPLYIFDPKAHKESEAGKASNFFLKKSLDSLKSSYKALGADLIIKKGDPKTILNQIVKTYDVEGIYYNKCYEPYKLSRNDKIEAYFANQGIEVISFNSNYLIDPEEFLNKQGSDYKVFTPFYRAAISKKIRKPFPTPKIPYKKLSIKSDTLNITSDEHLDKYWSGGEKNALKKLSSFLRSKAKNYSKTHDTLSLDTSKLSPHLHFGELSPFTLFSKASSFGPFLRQIVWRDFANYILFHFPSLNHQNWNDKFNKFKWGKSQTLLKKWQDGQTGYPIVDAGMRELKETGFMHNRARMIVASFLTKDLMIHWKEGAKWFMERLVDADMAQNSMNWQWVAGSGPDASPFFRIFNPVLQGIKFDPKGEYVRKWAPEIKNLDNKWIHMPFDAPKDILEQANIILGKNYPKPIVDREITRAKALKAYKSIG